MITHNSTISSLNFPKNEKGFTFIEVIIATLMLMLVVGAIFQYFSISQASHNHVYDLKAVEALKSEANKLEAFAKAVSGTPAELSNNPPPANVIYLFKYNATTSQIDLPDPLNPHNVYYNEYFDTAGQPQGFTISIGDNNTIDNYHTYYETAFKNKYASLSDDEKRDIDLRTFTYCTYESGESPYDTDYNATSTPFQMDVSMVVIDDMGSPIDPEDDFLGYIGWWVEDDPTYSDFKTITIALQYWYPGVDWKSVDPEVIVMKTTVIK